MRIEWIPLGERARIEKIWTSLSAEGECPYFLSWGWVKTWLDCVPRAVSLKLALVEEGGAPVAAFFLGSHEVRRHRFVRSKSLFLNQTGLPEVDDLCIEYNGWVPLGARLKLGELLAQLPGDWDEFVLTALDAQAEPGRHLDGSLEPYRVAIEYRGPTPFVDLERVRKAGDYLALLSGNTRSQIRRTGRLYAERGALTLEAPTTVGDALDVFAELVTLHQRSWKSRCQSGAFTPFVLDFHQELIKRRFEHGEIQLLRLRSGRETVGCLYGFVWQNAVSFYQSGIAYESDARLKSGLLCHAQAVRHNAILGHRIYDFLAGEARYKESLATDRGTLVWARVQQPRWQFRVEEALKQARRQALELKARWQGRAGFRRKPVQA